MALPGGQSMPAGGQLSFIPMPNSLQIGLYLYRLSRGVGRAATAIELTILTLTGDAVKLTQVANVWPR
uniref:Uncharacterized protein n=1 Tax=viral metagenome TaxID=1070528 RepID=A0A6M3XYN7_9ZZZZ